jgi:hypothetical protein
MADQKARSDKVAEYLDQAADNVKALAAEGMDSETAMATLQATNLRAIALSIADLADVLAEVRDMMKEKHDG